MGGARIGAGRKVIPIGIKEAKGTRKHNQYREKIAPAVSKSKPCAPSWLNTRAKQIFKQMTRRLEVLGVATASHTEALSILSSVIEDVQRLSKFLDEQGDSYRDFYGRQNKRPEVSMRNEARRHMHSLLIEFGLTPSASNRIGKPKQGEKKNEFSDF